MKLSNLFNQFQQSSILTKLVLATVIGIWTIVLIGLVGSAILLLESPGQAAQVTPGGYTPTILLDPATGSAGSSVTVRGQGWSPGSMVLIYLSATETPDYALASAVADGEGRFSTSLIIPLTTQWLEPGIATVIARTNDNGVSAQATLEIVSVGELPTATPVTETPVSTPTETVSPTVTPTLQPGVPLATTITDLNVRAGPDTAYPVLGLLKAGQTAEITGRSADSGWWQIKFSGVAGERGWLSARYVTAQDAGNVPMVQAPALPLPPTRVPPTPTPITITDWRGEYYSNPNLNGAPVLVRNDVVISFDWGAGAPAAGLSADGFSARWTRNVGFPAGLYRFALTVDDGVRAWVNGNLIIDQWRDSSPKTYTADVRLAEGVHNIRIEYYERSGGALIDLRWQRLNDNQPPQPVTRGPYEVDEGSRVALDGSRSTDPDGWITRYEWDFNYDGRTFTVDSTDRNPRAYYGDGPATLTIALRVTDDRGASQMATTKVTVRNVAPGVEAGGPYTGQVGSPVSLLGTATDPSSVDQAGLSYRWDFGDGTTGNGPAVSHSYAQAGSYTARLTVTDKDGAQATDTATVQINASNQAPIAVITAPASGKVGESLAFNGGNSRDNDGTIVSYAWNFGDGTSADGVVANHSYSGAGAYEVTLTVKDNGGLTGSSAFTVQISDAVKTAPVAVITGPVIGQVGDLLSFSGSGSSDADGNIVSYNWDFGDGAIISGMNVSHSYGISGTYQVILTVIDNDGLAAQATQEITIDELVQLELPPNVSFSAPASGQVGESLSFDGSASDDPDGRIVNYAWNFGDGISENSALPLINHSYASAGVYTVTLTITDNDGLINTTTHEVAIN